MIKTLVMKHFVFNFFFQANWAKAFCIFRKTDYVRQFTAPAIFHTA